jgi:tetratricopeptide (TPR) repeat protein
MPGRFANLEFNEHRQAGVEEVRLCSATDNLAARYHAQAADAHRWGRFEEALRLFTRALGEDRTCVAAWVGQVQMLVLLDECHEARVWSDKALELFRNHGDLLAAKAQACARLSDRKAALECSDGAMRAPGDSPWRWAARGEVLLARRERLYEECFQKAVSHPAADWFDRVVVARILRHYDRLAAALHYLQQAVAIEPGHGAVWFEMAGCQRGLGLVVAAQTSYGRCLELRPDWIEARRALDDLDRGISLHRGLAGWLRGRLRR